MIAPQPSRKSSEVLFASALTGFFSLLVLGGILRHELWRDESQAWLLARDSASVLELFANMQLEGHPALWHLALFALSRIGSDPLLMQLFHVAIASASVYVIARFSPFGRLQRCLLAFGYFNVYEYAIISRSYALGLLIVFVFCALHAGHADRAVPRPPRERLLPFLLLAVLANTSIYGLFISVALSISLLWPGGGDATRRSRLATYVGTSAMIGGWLLCYLQVSRINRAGGAGAHVIDELSESGGGGLMELIVRLSGTLSQVWRSYVPVPAFWSDHPWSSNFLADAQIATVVAGQDIAKILALLASLALIVLTARLLRDQPRWLATYLLGTAMLLAFRFFFFDGMIRHHGHLFILFVACLWLARADGRQVPGTGAGDGGARAARDRRGQSVLLGSLLVFHVGAGAIFHVLDWTRPFSGSKSASDFIRDNALEALPILGYRDREVSTLSAYLDRPIFYPNSGRLGSYWVKRDKEEWSGIRPAIRDFVARHDGPVVLVLTEPLTLPVPGTRLERLAYAEGAIARRESFYLYLAVAR